MQTTEAQVVDIAESTVAEQRNSGLRYQVDSVAKTPGPAGSDGDDWYCYVLKGGRSPIKGWRRGTLQEVKAYARRCAEELNERSSGKRRSPWAPQRSK
jgi:hypothetical protein